MRKKITTILFILIITFLVGCKITDIPIPNPGPKPTKPFIVDDYYQSNAIIQQKKDFKLTGTSEPGVVLKASLYNSKNRLIDQNYGVVLPDETWKITLEAPVASFETYRIEICDMDLLYQVDLDNLLFGEVWLLIGEGFINQSGTLQQPYDSSLRFFEQKIESGVWLKEDITKINLFSYHFALKIRQAYNLPVGIILAQVGSAHLDAWLNPKLIENPSIFNFTELVTRDVFEPYDKQSFLYQQKIEPISKVNINGVIFHQGITDILDKIVNPKLYFQLYAKTLTHLMEDLFHLFLDEAEFYLIQEPSADIDNIVYLRNAQATGSFYYTYTTIIPTYDFIDDNGLSQEDIMLIAERTSLSARTKTYRERNNYLAPVYTNLIISKNKIEIEFTNITRFDKINVIETLIIKDIFDEVMDDVKIEFDKNWLVINFEPHLYDLVGSISYAMEKDATTANLKSNGIPTIPFKIIINESMS